MTNNHSMWYIIIVSKLIYLIIFFLFLAITPVTFAASSKIGVGTKIQNANLNITFSNLSKAKNISYELTYNRSGGQEGVVGSVTKKGKLPVIKKILLGTCSTKVCTLHKNISNIKLKVIVKYLNGSTETKSYKIK